jgi:hypothetical protein
MPCSNEYLLLASTFFMASSQHLLCGSWSLVITPNSSTGDESAPMLAFKRCDIHFAVISLRYCCLDVGFKMLFLNFVGQPLVLLQHSVLRLLLQSGWCTLKLYNHTALLGVFWTYGWRLS